MLQALGFHGGKVKTTPLFRARPGNPAQWAGDEETMEEPCPRTDPKAAVIKSCTKIRPGSFPMSVLWITQCAGGHVPIDAWCTDLLRDVIAPAAIRIVLLHLGSSSLP